MGAISGIAVGGGGMVAIIILATTAVIAVRCGKRRSSTTHPDDNCGLHSEYAFTDSGHAQTDGDGSTAIYDALTECPPIRPTESPGTRVRLCLSRRLY